MQKRLVRVPIVLLCISVAFLLFTRTNKFLTVSGSSMEPTLYERDLCLVENFIVPERGDIYIVVEPSTTVWAVKRLIGVPGDTVELRDGATIVNGIDSSYGVTGTWEDVSFELGADEYLFLGDNRADSFDGRHWERPVNRSEILYRVVFRIYPLSKLGRLE